MYSSEEYLPAMATAMGSILSLPTLSRKLYKAKLTEIKEIKMGETLWFQTYPLSSFVSSIIKRGTEGKTKVLQHQKDQMCYLVAFIKEY